MFNLFKHSLMIALGAVSISAHAMPVHAVKADAGTERGEQGRAFTVEAAISIRYPLRISVEGETTVFTPDLWQAPGTYALFSLNGERFFTVDRRGALKHNALIDALHIYRTADFRDRPGGDASRIDPVYSIERRSLTNLAPMQKIKWASETKITFISADENSLRQVFEVDTARKKVKQLTRHPTSVVNYDVSAGTLAFYARQEDNTHAARSGRSQLLIDPYIDEVLSPSLVEGNSYELVELYVQSKRDKSPRRVPLPASISFDGMLTDIHLSPDGKRMLFSHPYINPLPEFAEYPKFGPNPYYTEDMEGETAGSKKLFYVSRLWAYDVGAGEAQPVAAAPYSPIAGFSNNHDRSVLWTGPDSVIIPGQFMPLSGTEGAERQRRARGTAVVHLDFKTGEAAPILYQPLTSIEQVFAGAAAPSIVKMHWDACSRRLLLKREPDAARSGEGTWYEAYAHDGERWAKTEASADEVAVFSKKGPDIAITVNEGLNTPPVYEFAAAGTETRTVFRDLNPQLTDVALAQTERRSWTDGNGLEWTGGLIYPVNYQPGKRYPLIVQTHGFRPSEFIVDGPDRVASAYAARVFSARGFFVMQMAESPSAITLDTREGARITAGYEGVVAMLTDEGLIDPKRVGAIGWSRTAFHVMQAAWRSPDLFASITNNDGIQRGYMEFMLGVSDGGEASINSRANLNGGSIPIGAGLDEWRKHAFTFNADKIKAAVLVEPIAARSLISMWETYAVLKILGTPVDLLYHPDGSHALQKPSERYMSQKLNVQWHQFWLTGIEDSDPAFEDQYDRWRKMRDDHCANLEADGKALPVYCR